MKGSRKFLSLLLTVAMIFTALPGTGNFLSYADDVAGYTVSMSSDSADVTEGGTFNVTLSVVSDSGSAGAAALHSEVKYDNSKIEFIKAYAPADSGLNADASAENGVVTVESYGQSQSVSGSGAAMAVLTFKALDGASGSTRLSFVSGKSLVGVIGIKTEIKVNEGMPLDIIINKADKDKKDVTFGLPDDGLTWNIIEIGGESINKSYRGGEVLASAAAKGDVIKFSINADEGIQYVGLKAHYSHLSNSTDAGLSESDGIYTVTMQEQNISVDATTLRIQQQDDCKINVTLKSVKNGKITGAHISGEIIPAAYKKLISLAYSTDGGAKWSYKSSDLMSHDEASNTYIADDLPLTAIDNTESVNQFGNKVLTIKAECTKNEVMYISNEDELREFASEVNNGDHFIGATVALTDDIELTESWDEPAGKDKEHYFSGTFDGAGHAIRGLNINYEFDKEDTSDTATENARYFGLFGYLSKAVIKDLTVAGRIKIDNTAVNLNLVSTTGPYSRTGGIAGCEESSEFYNCINEVDITAHGGCIGGIVGGQPIDHLAESGKFNGCFNYGQLTVTGRNGSVCGITGEDATEIVKCGNYGNITIDTKDDEFWNNPPASSGGGEPTVSYHKIAHGYAAGMAQMAPSVHESFNKGNIKGRALRIGGLIAGETYSYAQNIEISDSYNTGALELPIDHVNYVNPQNDSFQAYVSGIVSGIDKGTITLKNCYNSGSVISQTVKYGKTGQLYIQENNVTVNVDNCYASDTEPSVTGLKAAALNVGDTSKFKDDEGSVNGGMPLLIWEAAAGSEEQYDVTFDTKDVKGNVTVYSDAARTQVIDAAGDGRYSLKAGTYYYTAKADGYEDVLGSFSVVRKAVTVDVNFRAVIDVTITVSPADAEFTLETTGGEAVQPKSSANGIYVFTLYKENTYKYNAKASGYNGQGRTFTADGTPVTVALTKSSSSGGETTDNAIYGSYNTGKTSTISKGGTYYIQKGTDTGSQGRITITTSEPVTLVGKGYSDDDMYEDLYIKYTVSGADLTLQDVYIHNDLNCDVKTDMGNIIDFTGKGNKFSFSGTNILDWDGNASGYAAIHVNKSTDLTISASDSDRLYLYKHEQGAGIGGNGGADAGEGLTSETNGDITFEGGTYFIKNSKQGAGIGAGAQASTQKPGKITLDGGTFYIIANSRSAAIGGSAGSSGASSGSDVYISDNASVTVNVDFAGAAIGGGGYAGGNDADGGTLYYGSGSIRTYIDENAVSSWSDKGVSKAGINKNIAVTAKVVNNSGKQLYLLELDTSKLNKSASKFTVKEGSSTIYSGRLHEYRYVNEDSQKSGQDVLSYTIDNWTSLDDSQLYLYMTGADHTLDVNGETVTAKWDASNNTFTLTYPDGTTGGGGSGGSSLAQDTKPLVSETVKAETKVDGTNASASVKKDDVDNAVKAVGSNTNAQIAIDAVSGKSGITHAEVTIPMESVKTIQKDTKADAVIKTDLGDITVANSDLSALITGTGSDVTFTIDKNSDGSMKLNITSGGKNIAAGRYILGYKYKADDAVMKALAGKTGIDNSNLVGVLLGAKGADGNVTQTIIRDSFVTADGYVVVNAPVGGTVTAAANGRSFSDVASSAWYAKAVGFAVSHELFNGVSDDEFAPSKSMTRGMFVTVLNRLAGEEDFNGKTDFTDVGSDAWYATGTSWAASKGIVSGYGDGKFGPDDPVTREQMAVIMYNFTKAMGYDIKGSAALTKFSDSASVHSWAAEAMQWAVGTGIMSGNADGTLNPRGTATRAQVATIMSNYVQVLLGVK